MGRFLLCRSAHQRVGPQGLGTHPRNRETRRYGKSHRDRHTEMPHRGSSSTHPGAYRLRQADNCRSQQIPFGKRGSYRHPRNRQHRSTQRANWAPQRPSRTPRRSCCQKSACRHHGMRTHKRGQPPRPCCQGSSRKSVARRDFRCLRRSCRPL